MRDGAATNPARVETFEMLDEAEKVAQLLSERLIQPSWIPTRYPGRASRLHEIAVYLDRRTLSRREVTILRCEGADLACDVNRNGDAMWPASYFHARDTASGVQSTH